MAKKHTIYDVAKRAGVAISTVSRVLNQSPYVSDSTKSRVEKAISELDFYPQVNARNLARKEAQLISVAVPTFTTPFFNEVLKGVKDEIKTTGLDFIIYNTGSDNPEANFTGFVEKGIPDAMIIFSIEITETIHKRLKDLPIPVILVGYEHPDYDYIYWDNYHGGYIAAEHLIKQGFTKIGMIRPHSKSTISDQRERGFRDALRENGIPMDEDYLVSGITRKHAGFSEEAGAEAINILLARNKMPQAIFCSNDAQAIGAIHSLEEKGFSVPGDVAVMGYDNIKISNYLNLSTIDQKMYEVGKASIKRLAERIKNSDMKPMQTLIKPELVVRKSTTKV
ncbi:MAG TPA: LacI family transcriptional regulator [Bacteroidetes bacterium]|nr:LacI family transcriptional regulator [Bacteroidota bacterium]